MDYKFIKTSFLLAICLLLGIIINDMIQIYTLKKKNVATIEENEYLIKKNELLKTEIHLLENNNSYIQLIAREKLGMIKEGEIVYKFLKK
ncbi:MAG: septum formation initiator family protein [Deltaproteobacteria bacterium TMED126]|jgi:cell division protein FtsB|nr:septum formation initiator family protein [Candidatus Dadabacteria bacterium]NSW97270.1 septum formation initiator family protein [Deltaproteobacteria bacterium TMED126]|tara:strand:- start:15624 stop:15893 length:270 start_codon:yes stop_codon:yes gene_type:complete